VSGLFVKTARRELDNGLDLFAVESVEPFHDVVDAGTGLDILENRRHGHARSAQYPGTAHLA
jgi:hypothetical protein